MQEHAGPAIAYESLEKGIKSLQLLLYTSQSLHIIIALLSEHMNLKIWHENVTFYDGDSEAERDSFVTYPLNTFLSSLKMLVSNLDEISQS